LFVVGVVLLVWVSRGGLCQLDSSS
jgi:hypothetical protein